MLENIVHFVFGAPKEEPKKDDHLRDQLVVGLCAVATLVYLYIYVKKSRRVATQDEEPDERDVIFGGATR